MKQNKHEQHNDGNLMESIWHYLRILMECMQSFAVGGAIAHFRKGLLLGYFDLQACFDGETFVQGLCASHCIADKHCWRPNQTHAANSCKCWGLLAPKVLLKDHWPTMDGWMDGWDDHPTHPSPRHKEKGGATKSVEFLDKFSRGVGVIFNPQFILQIFGT